ncbi:hypothetical protein Thiowin_03187 [Thiorhodovibrio winogradskyi]|uniref:PIN domain-containing protein n=1 Tax=Thiorhodovibrio winogradskyi TaxID=77007 RepID=A0ABZ0SCV0_9GAMM
MGFLIDTNILSEVQNGERTDPGVRAWYDCVEARDLYLSVLVIGEVRQGIERLRCRDPAQAERLMYGWSRSRRTSPTGFFPSAWPWRSAGHVTMYRMRCR